MKLVPIDNKSSLILLNPQTKRSYCLKAPFTILENNILMTVVKKNLYVIPLNSFSIAKCKIQYKFENEVISIFATENFLTVLFDDYSIKMFIPKKKTLIRNNTNNAKPVDVDIANLKINNISDFSSWLEKENDQKILELDQIASYAVPILPLNIYSDSNCIFVHSKTVINIFPQKIKFDIPENTMSCYDNENSLVYFFDYMNLYVLMNNCLEHLFRKEDFYNEKTEPIKFSVFGNFFIIAMKKYKTDLKKEDVNSDIINSDITSSDINIEDSQKTENTKTNEEIISSTDIDSFSFDTDDKDYVYEIKIININNSEVIKVFENLSSSLYTIFEKKLYYSDCELLKEFSFPNFEDLKIKKSKKIKQSINLPQKEEKEAPNVIIFKNNKNIAKRTKKEVSVIKNEELDNLFDEESSEKVFKTNIREKKSGKNLGKPKISSKEKILFKSGKTVKNIKCKSMKILEFKNNGSYIQLAKQDESYILFIKNQDYKFFIKSENKILAAKNFEEKTFIIVKSEGKNIIEVFNKTNKVKSITKIDKKVTNLSFNKNILIAYRNKFAIFYESKDNDLKMLKKLQLKENIQKCVISYNFVYFLSKIGNYFLVYSIEGDFISKNAIICEPKSHIDYFTVIKIPDNNIKNEEKAEWYEKDYILYKRSKSPEIFVLNYFLLNSIKDSTKENLKKIIDEKEIKIGQIQNRKLKILSINEKIDKIFYCNNKLLTESMDVGFFWDDISIVANKDVIDNLKNDKKDKKIENKNLRKRFNPFK